MEKTVWDIKINWKHAFLHFGTFLSNLMPFILSHHPECDAFSENHYVRPFGIKLCIGCFFTYPTVFILLLLQAFFHYWELIPTSFAVFAVIGIILIQISAFLDFGEGNLPWKIFTKITLGIGLIFVFLLFFRLSLPPVMKWVGSFYFYLIAGSLFGLIRAFRMHSICSACSKFATFPMCAGFTKILHDLQANDFIELTERKVIK